FMERSIIEIVEKHLNIELPHHEYEAFLMIFMEGESESEITEYFINVENICKKHGAIDATIPNSERAKRRLLNARENFYNALRKFAPMELIDVVVPRNEIAGFVGKVKELSQKHEIPVIVYGHAGDGNVHLHPVCIDMDINEWKKRLPGLMKDIYNTGSAFGGAISGEHGIGFEKKPYLINEIDRESLDIMKKIKIAFDPNNILNPGKIFDV
ncbi:FAD-binding oxidoreductase, partial [Chloroflexota bacterium]